MERVNLLNITDVRVTVTDVNVSLLADFYEGSRVPAYIDGYIAAQELPDAPRGGIVDAIIEQELTKAEGNAVNFAASMGIIPDAHKPVVLDALQRELDTRVLERILNDAVGPVLDLDAMPVACCERDYDGDGNCDRHPADVANGGDALLDALFGDPANADFGGITERISQI
jgi:hypothetical protein